MATGEGEGTLQDAASVALGCKPLLEAAGISLNSSHQQKHRLDSAQGMLGSRPFVNSSGLPESDVVV